MLSLKFVKFEVVQHFFVDFQKKSKCFELPPDSAHFLGAYSNGNLVGYYALVGEPKDGYLCIHQGYLLREARHQGLVPLCMQKLEALAKQAGFHTIVLATNNRFQSYTQFMSEMGYKPSRIEFLKRL